MKAQSVPVAFLDFSHQLVGGELSPDHEDQVLDDVLGAVHVQQTSNHHRQTGGVHLQYTNKIAINS